MLFIQSLKLLTTVDAINVFGWFDIMSIKNIWSKQISFVAVLVLQIVEWTLPERWQCIEYLYGVAAIGRIMWIHWIAQRFKGVRISHWRLSWPWYTDRSLCLSCDTNCTIFIDYFEWGNRKPDNYTFEFKYAHTNRQWFSQNSIRTLQVDSLWGQYIGERWNNVRLVSQHRIAT